jgi:hypothetical protein
MHSAWQASFGSCAKVRLDQDFDALFRFDWAMKHENCFFVKSFRLYTSG